MSATLISDAGLDMEIESIKKTTGLVEGKPFKLTEEQIRSYIENGYFLVPDLLRQDEVAAIKGEAAGIARTHMGASATRLNDAEVLNSVLAINTPHYVSETIREVAVLHPKICSVLSQVTGAHLAHWTGNVKAMYTILFVKPPGFQGQAWHQDESYIPSRDRSLTAAWIALDDATIENGCLWVVPGSHKTGYMFPVRPHGRMDEYDFNDESYGFDEGKQIVVEMKAGSVVFFNGYLLHKSTRNRSNVHRRSLVTHYMSSESLAPWMAAETGEPIARADNRRVVQVAGRDPYEWKGYEDLGDKVGFRMCSASLKATASLKAK